MTIKKFLKDRPGMVCITGWVAKLKGYVFLTDRPVIRFPENGKHVEEQATFVKQLQKGSMSKNAIVITHSAFIVTDFKQDDVLVIPKKGKYDLPYFNTFGASVNKINMCLFRHAITIGALAQDTMQELLARPQETLEQINETIALSSKCLGDSVEYTLMMHKLLNREDELKKGAVK